MWSICSWQKAIENGIDVIRIFDALNDTRNMKRAMEATKRFGGHCEAAISYTTSPVHTREYFVKLAKELEDMGADTICIKDMANLLLPYEAYALVTDMKKVIKVPIHVHTHNKAGTGDMTYLKAIEGRRGNRGLRTFNDGKRYGPALHGVSCGDARMARSTIPVWTSRC